jgi:UDP-N-acetylglucosamine 2-epimerase (non-hydrolysing)
MTNSARQTVVTVVGTRPEIIRLSRVIPALDKYFNHVLVHTGQNHDPMLSEVFFEELEIRRPDVYLDVDTSSLGSVLGQTLQKIEKVLLEHSPNAVLILGDTNSAISAIIAKRLHIPVYHMEAGNRSFDSNVPEELNRKMIDHIATFNLPYTEFSRRNLVAEGIHPRFIQRTGSPVREIYEHNKNKISKSVVLDNLRIKPNEYFVVSVHRQENVDLPDRLDSVLSCLVAVRDEWKIPIIVSTHPRTRARLDAISRADLSGIIFHEPFGYLDYNKLQIEAKCVISDSGTIGEESAILGFDAVTLRDSMERPEVLESGSLLMSGLDPNGLVRAIKALETLGSRQGMEEGYEVVDFSSRVLKFLLSTADQALNWRGIRV